MVDKLIEAFSSPETCGDVCDVDWLIMPLLNPDGYEYSRTTDRMWRKNRSKPKDRKDSFYTKISSSARFFSLICKGSSSSCRGVDLNRNYDTVGFGIGGSDDPCSDSYKGETANSEPEVKAAYGETGYGNCFTPGKNVQFPMQHAGHTIVLLQTL